MKKVLLMTVLIIPLFGCTGTVDPSRVSVSSAFDVIYIWDNEQKRYFHIENGQRYYMPEGWRVEKDPLPR